MVLPICFVCATYPGNYGLHCFALHHWCIVRCDDTKPCGSEHRLCAWLVQASLVKKRMPPTRPRRPSFICFLRQEAVPVPVDRRRARLGPPTRARDAGRPRPVPRTSGQRVWSGRPCLPRVRGGGGDESWGHHAELARVGGVAHEAAGWEACHQACCRQRGWRLGQPAWRPTPRPRRGPALLHVHHS